jgi:hypothetical protein
MVALAGGLRELVEDVEVLQLVLGELGERVADLELVEGVPLQLAGLKAAQQDVTLLFYLFEAED